MRCITLILILLLNSGCSTRTIYHNTQHWGEWHAGCRELIDTADAKACEDAFDMPYDEYRRQRKDLVKEQDPEPIPD